jgi:hypothetical protein
VVGLVGWPVESAKHPLDGFVPAIMGAYVGAMVAAIVVTSVAVVGAIRRARPSSWWARHFWPTTEAV